MITVRLYDVVAKFFVENDYRLIIVPSIVATPTVVIVYPVIRASYYNNFRIPIVNVYNALLASILYERVRAKVAVI